MNALRISLGFLLAVTLVCALEKDNPTAANDAQPVNAAHAQEDGIKHAANATFRPFLRRHHVPGPDERRNAGDAKDGVRNQRIHRRSNSDSDDDKYSKRREVGKNIVLFFLIAPFILMCLCVFIGVGLSVFLKDRKDNRGRQGGRVIQPVQPSGQVTQPAQPSPYRVQPMAQGQVIQPAQTSPYRVQPVAQPHS